MFGTLPLDMGDIQPLFQSQDNSTKLEVKGITSKEGGRKKKVPINSGLKQFALN